MALSSAKGVLTVNSTDIVGTTIPATIGFPPKVVFVWWSGTDASGSGVATSNHRRGFGWATSPTNRASVTTFSQTGSGSALAATHHSNSALVAEVDSSPAVTGAVDVQSFDASGFTLVVDDQFAATMKFQYWALGGDSLTNAMSVEFTPAGGAPVTQDITGFGFDPDLCLFMGRHATASVNTPAIDSGAMFGVARSTTEEAIWTGGTNSGSGTMQAMSYCRRGECVARFAGNITTIQDRAEFSAFITDGVRINWLERVGTGSISVLGLKGLSAIVGDLLTQTDTTTPITETGFGFRPGSALFVSAARAEDAADTPTDHDHWSIGVAIRPSSTSGNQGVYATMDEDNITTSDVTIAHNHTDSVYLNISTAGALQGDMTVQSFGDDGLTAMMDDADPSQNFVWYLALGPETQQGRRYFLV